MIQSMTEILYFNDLRKQEQSTYVLGATVEAAPGMAQPYVPSLLSNAVERLVDKSTEPLVIIALLNCIGKLVRYANASCVQDIEALRPLIVAHILDGVSLEKRFEAIRALIEVVRATKNVAVYDEHPELLKVLLSCLHGGFKQTWRIRQEVLKLLGVIGAVDPVKVKLITRSAQEKSNTDTVVPKAHKGGDAEAAAAAAHVVVSAALEVLKYSTQDEHCALAAKAIVDVFYSRELQLKEAIGYFRTVIDVIIRHIHEQPKNRGKLFQSLRGLVTVAKHRIRSYLPEMFDTIRQFLKGDEVEALNDILHLLGELRQSLNEEFRPYVSQVLPLLVRLVQQDVVRCSSPIFECFNSFGRVLNGHLHIVLPCILDVISNPSVDRLHRIEAASVLTNIAKVLATLSDHAARCIHCLCRVLSEAAPIVAAPRPAQGKTQPNKQENELANACLTALCSIAFNLGPSMSKFQDMTVSIVVQRFGEGSREETMYRGICERCKAPPRSLEVGSCRCNRVHHGHRTRATYDLKVTDMGPLWSRCS